MPTRSRSLFPILVVVVLGAVLSWIAIAADAGPAEDSVARQTMAEFMVGLTTAFGSSLGPEQFQDPANRALIRQALKKLAIGSEELLAHGESLGKSTEGLRGAIAREAAETLTDFEAERFDVAQRRLHQLVGHCFSCHTRLPQADNSVIGERFAASVELGKLGLRERVFFLTATRQFDKALATIESALRSPDETPRRTSWLFEAYLKLAIRVHGSPGRACESLEEFLARSDPAPHLAARISSWIEDLGHLEERGELPLKLSTARKLIAAGRLRNDFPADKRGMVQFVAASGLLLRFLDSHDGDAVERAEAYYLLGIAESHISTTLWGDQTAFYLETAIRLRPHSELAAQAYSFLQEYEIVRHSGASNSFLPDSVQTHLDELGVLAAPSKGPA